MNKNKLLVSGGVAILGCLVIGLASSLCSQGLLGVLAVDDDPTYIKAFSKDTKFYKYDSGDDVASYPSLASSYQNSNESRNIYAEALDGHNRMVVELHVINSIVDNMEKIDTTSELTEAYVNGDAVLGAHFGLISAKTGSNLLTRTSKITIYANNIRSICFSLVNSIGCTATKVYSNISGNVLTYGAESNVEDVNFYTVDGDGKGADYVCFETTTESSATNSVVISMKVTSLAISWAC